MNLSTTIVKVSAFMVGLSVVFAPLSSLAASQKPRIAVINFDNKAAWGGWHLGNQAAEMLTSKLVKSKQFSVYERDQLESILKEQNLGQAGLVTAASAAKVGKLIGVEFMVIGAVTEFGESDTNVHGSGFGVNRNTYAATVDVRVVSATSGEILMSETASSEASNVRVSVMGFGGGKSGYDEKLAAEVLREAIDKVTEQIITQIGDMKPAAGSASTALTAKVAKVEGTKVWLNIGTGSGIAVGDRFTVYHQGEDIVDPDTGTSLGAEEERIGTLTITKVEEKFSIGTADTTSPVSKGDIIK